MGTKPGLGSFDNPLHLYFASLDTMSNGMGPMKAAARAQLELLGLMSRRAQAYMEIPSRLSRCRSPQDLMSEQARFWQIAFQQYQESTHKIMEAWGQALVMPQAAAPFASAPRRERDYISFPDIPGTNGQAPPRSMGERRVA
jgi:hypothetical protein